MNRAQAEHILDAYVLLSTTNMEDASDSLREVILDAMTEYKTNSITMGSPWRIETLPCSYPTNRDGTPKVTCTGIDPMFWNTTSASTVYANGHTQEAVE